MVVSPHDLDKMVVEDLKSAWGGRLPTWDEFKKANKDGQVKVNKGIATQTLGFLGASNSFYILFGIITPWATFLIPIISVILYFFGKCNGWVVPACFFCGYYLYKVTLAGACAGIRYGAEEDEALYQHLVSNGAFLFEPTESVNL